MEYKQKIRWVGLVLIACTVFVAFSSPFQEFVTIPDEIRIFEGKSSQLALTLPTTGTVHSSAPEVVQVKQQHDGRHLVRAVQSGLANIQFKWRSLPLKSVRINVLPQLEVYPGGQSIGVRLNSEGPLVVGHHFIRNNNERVSPAEKANIQIGDMILKMNDERIKSLDQIRPIVDETAATGKPIRMELLRGKEIVHAQVDPVLDPQENKLRLGLYIRNTAAGVGTMTFIHPQSQKFGALGHVISDMDTQRPIVLGDGHIVHSNVNAIEKGLRGSPGEKFSSLDDKRKLGSVTKNTPFGIFGKMDTRLSDPPLQDPIPVGLSEEVEKGPAHILTVVEGDEVEKFDIEIVDIVNQRFPATKGLIIRVTDEQLLEKTGGIVQGMSGSPIIQNGKLIGAVTHVFVNDPTSGYGCFIEWMLQDADISVRGEKEKQPRAS